MAKRATWLLLLVGAMAGGACDGSGSDSALDGGDGTLNGGGEGGDANVGRSESEDERGPTSLLSARVLRTEEGEVKPNVPLTLGDGAVSIAFQQLHASYRLESDLYAPLGVPYVSVGNAWLELTNALTVAAGGRVFRVTRGECRTSHRIDGDYGFYVLDACGVRVDELDFDPSPAPTAGGTLRFDYEPLISMTRRSQASAPLAAVRTAGFALATVQSGAPPTFPTIKGGLDIVTSFGVKNLDLEKNVWPAASFAESFELGPQRVTLRVVDAAPPQGDCTDRCVYTYSIEVAVEPLPGAPAEAESVVLAYE